MAETFDRSINNFTKNKYYMSISNFPNLTNIPDDQVDLSSLSSYVQSVDVPNITVQQLYSYWQHERQQHPNPTGARETNVLTIEWILDDKFMNYYLFYCWAKGTRYGIPARARDDEEQKALLRDNCIDRLDIYSLDNTKTPASKVSFHRVFLTGIGNLNLQFGDSSIVTFSTTFEYEQFGMTAQGKKEDGSLVLEPLNKI